MADVQAQRAEVLEAAIAKHSDFLAQLSTVRSERSTRQTALLLAAYVDVDEEAMVKILKKCEGSATVNAQVVGDPRAVAREVAAATLSLGYAIAREQGQRVSWWRRIRGRRS